MAKKPKEPPSKTGKKRSPAGIALAFGAAAAGVGAGLVIERLLVGRQRLRPDPFAGEPYGRLKGDRTYTVPSPDGAILHVEEVGPEQAHSGAIFLHGYCLDRTVWHHQMTALDSGRRHVYYDARHHGKSLERGHDGAELKILAADLLRIVEKSGLSEIVLVGHSMGGMTVLEFCREFPQELGDRIKGIVLVNTTYTDAIKTIFAADVIAPIERGTRSVLEKLLSDQRSARALRLRGDDFSWMLVRWFGFGPGASPTQVGYIGELLSRFPSVGLVETLQGLRRFDMEGALEAIDVPTLIIAGGQDRITTVSASEAMNESIPQSKLHIFEGAGHCTMMERSEQFNEIVDEFLDKTLEVPISGRSG